MKNRATYLTLFCIILMVLTACSTEQYSPVKMTKSIVATVNIKDMTISFIDMKTEKKVQEWKMKKPYTGGLLLEDGDSILLYGKQNDTVDLYSLSKGTLLKEWQTGKGIVNGILLHNNKEVAFADQTRNQIRFFNIDGTEQKAVDTKQNPLTLLEGKEQLYVISFDHRKLSKIDLKKRQLVGGFQIHPSAAGALLREDQDEIWIGGHGEGVKTETEIHVYNATTGTMKKTVNAPLMPVNFLENNDAIFVLSHGTSTLYKITKSGEIEKSIKVGANPFEMKFYDSYIIIAGYDSNDVHFVNLDTLKIEKTIKVGKGPFQIITKGT